MAFRVHDSSKVNIRTCTCGCVYLCGGVRGKNKAVETEAVGQGKGVNESQRV